MIEPVPGGADQPPGCAVRLAPIVGWLAGVTAGAVVVTGALCVVIVVV